VFFFFEFEKCLYTTLHKDFHLLSGILNASEPPEALIWFDLV